MPESRICTWSKEHHSFANLMNNANPFFSKKKVTEGWAELLVELSSDGIQEAITSLWEELGTVC